MLYSSHWKWMEDHVERNALWDTVWSGCTVYCTWQEMLYILHITKIVCHYEKSLCCKSYCMFVSTISVGYSVVFSPDRLNPDWCRLRTGWGAVLTGEVLPEVTGVMTLGVTVTSHTGPSYRPRGTPRSSASCEERRLNDSKSWISNHLWWVQLGVLCVYVHLSSFIMCMYPAAGLYPLVDVVWEGFTGDVASRTLSGVQVPVL